jgi:hypothetical protein
MSNFIEINTDAASKQIADRLKPLFDSDKNKAINRAINHTLGKANTHLNKEIRSVYKIALSDLNDDKQKWIEKSSESTLTGTIRASISPLSLSKFNPVWVRDRLVGQRKNSALVSSTKKGSKKVKRGNQGVTIEVVKGKKILFHSAFLLFNKGGTPVMARGKYNGDDFNWGQKRKPISKLNTKSVFYAIFNDEIIKSVNEKINRDYPERVIHEINYMLSQQFKQ